MALRPVADDYLQGFRFQAQAIGGPGINFFDGDRVGAGFNNITTPEATIEIAEYKEGTDIWTKKQPGNPTVNNSTFQRGVTRGNSAFWNWARKTIEGVGEYRATVIISQYHRVESLTTVFPVAGFTENETQISTDGDAMEMHLYNAFPTRCKITGDLDATASDISIQELDVDYESFGIKALAAV